MESKSGKRIKRQIKKGPPSMGFPLEDQESPAPCVKFKFSRKRRARASHSALHLAVEALGWEVWLESPGHNKGCTWWLRFPTNPAELSTEPEPSADAILSNLVNTEDLVNPEQMIAALHLTARSKAQEWKRRLAANVEIVKVPQKPGCFLRSPQGFVQNVERVTLTPPDSKMPLYRGLAAISVEWRSPEQTLFNSEKEAHAAALTESTPGVLYLLYILQGGAWRYLRTMSHTPAQGDWKVHPSIQPEPESVPEGEL